MIRSITLENFKALRDPVTIQLSWLNLIFGPNGAGKSAVVESLSFLQQVFESRETGEELSNDLFARLVREHNSELPIRVSVEFDFGTPIVNYSKNTVSEPDKLLDVIGNASDSARVTLEIRASPNGIFVTQYEIDIDGV